MGYPQDSGNRRISTSSPRRNSSLRTLLDDAGTLAAPPRPHLNWWWQLRFPPQLIPKPNSKRTWILGSRIIHLHPPFWIPNSGEEKKHLQPSEPLAVSLLLFGQPFCPRLQATVLAATGSGETPPKKKELGDQYDLNSEKKIEFDPIQV